MQKKLLYKESTLNFFLSQKNLFKDKKYFIRTQLVSNIGTS